MHERKREEYSLFNKALLQYSLFYRALLQKGPIIVRNLLIVATIEDSEDTREKERDQTRTRERERSDRSLS